MSPATKQNFALDSTKCTRHELGQFVLSRGIRQVVDGQSPTKLIKCLEAADDAATFPFTKLVPELRLYVYLELLTLQRDEERGEYCYSEILRASK